MNQSDAAEICTSPLMLLVQRGRGGRGRRGRRWPSVSDVFNDASCEGFASGARGIVYAALGESEAAAAIAAIGIEFLEGDFLLFG